MKSQSRHFTAVLPLLVLWLATSHAGASEGGMLGGRETTDREGDLQRRLLESGRAAAAEQICRDALSSLPPGDDESAKWAIRLSRAILRRGTDARPIDSACWSKAANVLDGWLRGYEPSRRVAWVRFARAMVDFRSAEVATLELRAAPEKLAGREGALSQQRHCEKQFDELARTLTATIPLAELGRDPSLPPASELRVLARSVERQQIRLLLSRADLYPPGSDDALAAAVSAAERARKLATKTPSDDAALADTARLEANAWLRSGDTVKAQAAIQQLIPLHEEANGEVAAGSVSPQTLAVLVRIAQAETQFDRAQGYLDQYYETSSAATLTKDAPSAPPELDLVRLELILRDRKELKAAAEWADAIESRHGRYFGRLASLELVEYNGIRATGNAVSDPRLLAATAGAMLRRGELAAAASQFAAASRMASDPTSKFNFGLSAAAAYQRAGNLDLASEHLAAAATASPQHELAEAAHFQASLLLAKADQAAPSKERWSTLEAILTDHLQQWPKGKYVERVKAILTERFESRGDWAAAARTNATGTFDPSDVADRWHKALRLDKESEARDKLVREAVGSLRSPRATNQQAAEIEAVWITAIWGDDTLLGTIGRDSLAALRVVEEPESIVWRGRLAAQVIDMRQDSRTKLDQDLIASANDDSKFDLLQRLSAGAGVSGDNANGYWKNIADLSETLAPKAVETEQRLLILSALVDSKQVEKAVSILDRLPPDRANPAIAELATILMASAEVAHKQKGIELMSRFGRGLIKGSNRWSEVQLQIFTAMQQVGDAPQAAKLASYILLTSPPQDALMRSKIQKFADGDTNP